MDEIVHSGLPATTEGKTRVTKEYKSFQVGIRPLVDNQIPRIPSMKDLSKLSPLMPCAPHLK